MDFTKDDTSHISLDGGGERLDSTINDDDESKTAVDAAADPVDTDAAPNTTIASPTEDSNTQRNASTPNKERHSLTLDQRRSLRRWANSQVIRPSHKACIDWFESQYGLVISQSTVSHSLSPKYTRLDGDSQLSGSRLRFGNWPDVEKLVLVWHADMVNRGRPPSNEELVQKATQVFESLPRYKGEKPPNFSPGWVHRFKKRYGLLMRRRSRFTAPHGQDGSSPDGNHLDLPYLVDLIPRIMSLTSNTPPGVIQETIQRVVSLDVSLDNCTIIRDTALRGAVSIEQQSHMDIAAAAAAVAAATTSDSHDRPSISIGSVEGEEDDPELALQKALRQIQQQEEVSVAQGNGGETQIDTCLMPARNSVGTLVTSGFEPHQQQHQQTQQSPPQPQQISQQQMSQQQHGAALLRAEDNLKLTPIPSASAPQLSGSERPVRCPFCVNTRMLRSIKEAVEHLSTHVVV
ncbi:hypothetical protein MCOR27_011809 [Pyricularia oryzae]|uniref:HTH CENPB-type domain-containing protein n=2 Tax=Pyricularia grisea TaxID=148305 RepID=A0ABQ8N6Z2_PYRGI|nr:hypothetical protein MCOR01_011832 [Pyricularia oryzae]KAI6292305.1 hypothetical protein MCOR33_011789 [Pyricularia grisea]KAH9438952.1 hypothetical protein MCOR02_012518 [Pyricularia oryzae]KAI6253252.1 hypothetical protein MCOR19_011801 [Pyricularia oryzae]KAI6267718.1 hypothetical protein MCOR27_011809 [Pyricularia oryzae]